MAQDNTQARSTAKDYLARYDGPKIPLDVVFGSPVIKQIYKRDSQIFARNALFITFFARIAFDDKTVDPLEEALIDKIKKLGKKFEDKVTQAQTLMRENSLEDSDMCQNNLPVVFDVTVTSPLYRQLIELLRKADNLINYYDTLWMNGQVPSSKYNEMRFEVKRDLRGIIAFVRNTWIGLQKRVQHDRVSKLQEAIGETVGSEITEQPGEALTESKSKSKAKPKTETAEQQSQLPIGEGTGAPSSEEPVLSAA